MLIGRSVCLLLLDVGRRRRWPAAVGDYHGVHRILDDVRSTRVAVRHPCRCRRHRPISVHVGVFSRMLDSGCCCCREKSVLGSTEAPPPPRAPTLAFAQFYRICGQEALPDRGLSNQIGISINRTQQQTVGRLCACTGF